MYIVKSFESGLWTVGTYGDSGWNPDSDHTDRDDADRRAFFLNHGRDMDAPADPAPSPVTVGPWELFAAAALSGVLASHTTSSPPATKVAAWTAEYADAMLIERAKRNGGGPLVEKGDGEWAGAFRKGQLVRHKASGGLYRVVLTWAADGLRLEGTDRPAYAYRIAAPTGGNIWVRDAEEMEDGRFVVVPEPAEGGAE